MSEIPPFAEGVAPTRAASSVGGWSGRLRRHLVDDAPEDLADVEAAIDRMPHRWSDRLVLVGLVNATLGFWLVVAWWVLS